MWDEKIIMVDYSEIVSIYPAIYDFKVTNVPDSPPYLANCVTNSLTLSGRFVNNLIR
jgi:hypothetical protein